MVRSVTQPSCRCHGIQCGTARISIVANTGWPSTPCCNNIFAARTRNVVALPLDGEGVTLSAELGRCDYVFVTPSHQCPTNVTMPLARREALMAWAMADDRVLIEDDYEIELGFEGRAQPALKSLDREGRVVYVSSLSKTLAPGIRIGYIVGAPDLIREARALRRLMLRHPAANNERAVALFLAMGYHDALLRRMKEAHAERMRIAAENLALYLPDVTFGRVPGASSLWLCFPAGTDTRLLANRAQLHGVLIEPGDVFFAGGGMATAAPCPYARLGFAAIPGERIGEGLRALAAARRSLDVRDWHPPAGSRGGAGTA